MPDVENSPRVRRILVALEPSHHGRAALAEAASLAESLKAELVGLYVEDENLLRCARLPFVREFGSLHASGRRLDFAVMERMLRAQAEAMRREIEREAGVSNVKWSFRVVRGSVATEVVAAGEEADLIVVGRGQEGARMARVGSTARAVISRSRRSVFCTREKVSRGHGVLVFYDGTDAAGRALRTALDLARTTEDGVFVLLADGDRADEIAARASALLGDRATSARSIRMDGTSLAAVVEAAARHDVRVIVVAEEALGLSAQSVHELVDAIDRPVVVVR